MTRPDLKPLLAVVAAHPAALLLAAGAACLVAGVAWLAGPAVAMVLLGVLLLVGGVGNLRVRDGGRP